MTTSASERITSAADPATANRQLWRMLMIAYNYPPAVSAGVHRTLRFTKYLQEFGCVPTVLTQVCGSSPGGDALLSQVPEDVVIYRVGNAATADQRAAASSTSESSPAEPGADSGASGETRTRNWAVGTIKAVLRPAWDLITETPDQYIGWSRQAGARGLELCRSGGFDVVYTTGPPHSTHLAGLSIHRSTGLPWVADFRDPWARRPWVKSRNPWGRRLLPLYERKVVREATCVVVNNDASADDFRRTYPRLPGDKFVSIPNGYDPDLLPVAERLRQQWEAELNQGGARDPVPVLCHPGTLYGERNPRSILEAIAQLHRQGIEVRFQQIGYAAPRFDPLKTAEELGIEHLVECIPPVSHAEAMRHMSRADMLAIIQPNGPVQVPGKLYEMLLFDQPIIAVCDSLATSQVVTMAGNAWSVGSQDVEGIAAALRRVVDADGVGPSRQREQARACYNGRDLTKKLAAVVASMRL